MKKTLHSSNTFKNIKSGLLLILFIFSSSLNFSQNITPTKTVILRPGVCGKIDVELKIEGANPASKPLEVVLVIDVSGSMDDNIHNDPENSLEHAQDAAIDFINRVFLDENNATGKNKIAIVTYANSGTIVKHLLPSKNKQELIDAINNLNANGHTNIEDGILKASKELNENGTFDCITSRSIILLTDGVANRNVTNGNNCTDTQNGTCIQNAITAAKNAKTTSVYGVTYNNQIFSVGLFGAISGMSQTYAEFTLDEIQTAGKYFTENAADLNGIYTNIFAKLSWVAQQITGTPFGKETVSSDFTIGTVTPSKGTATVSGQVIFWNIDFLNVETITLKYELTPKFNVCGNKTVSSSRLDFKNSACTNTFLEHGSCSTNIPCPSVTLASQTNVNCFGCHSGAITLNYATGGTGSYSYAWKKNGYDYSINKNLTGLEAGIYTVITTDANGCASNELSVTITQPAVINATMSKTNINCNGDNNGTITVTNPTGGSGTYEYRLDTGTWQASGNFTALAPATYSVQVRDMANPACVITLCNQIITQPAVTVSVSGIATNVSCHGEKNGSIAITNSTGSTVVITNSANEAVSSTGLPAGTYTLTATAPNGNNSGFCTATSQVTITQPEVCVSVSGIATNVSCHGEKNGSIAVTNSAGSTVVITNDANQTVSATGLPAGTYTLTSTAPNGNANGFCTAASQVIISQPSAVLSATSVIINNNNCTNCSNGSINLTVTGGTEPYTFLWSNGATTEDIANLTKGSYSVEIKDKNGCIVNYTFIISESSINITKDGNYVDSNQDGITNAGDIVKYSFVITNTGTVDLTNLTITDNNAVVTGGSIPALLIGTSDSTTFSGTHVITQDDINTGYVYNLATVTAKDPEDKPVTDTSSDPTPCTSCPIDNECPDCTITPLTQSPKLEVIKTATTASYSKVGDIINYTITIKNSGNQTLHQIIVKDPLTGLDTTIAFLEPGTSSEYTQSYTVTQEDLNKGSVTNVATADGLTPNNTPISATDDEIVNGKTNPIDAVDDNAGTIVGVNQITPNVINVFTNDTLNALAVNPADVILTILTSNPFLLLNPDGSIDVLPDAPVGTQTMIYQICEKLNSTNCDTAVITVTIEGPTMTVAGETICINDAPYFSYTAAANNFTPVHGLTLTWADSNNNVIATMTNLPLNGRVLWPGTVVDDNGNGIDWPGWILTDNKWIEGADGFENLRPTAYITFTLNPSQTITANYPPSNPRCTSRPTFKIDAVDDTAGPIDGINGAVNVLNVFNNDTLNTIAVNPNDVTLTLVRPDPTGFMTMNPDGSIDLKEGALAGTYTLVYQICENADFGNCDTAIVTINVICNNTTKMAGMVFNAGTNTPLANVPVTLIPQGTTTGPILISITNAQGHYNFTGMPAGDYLLQVQDANLNSAYELYPVDSSLFFTSLEVCKYQFHDFGYDKSDLPVLGDFVWYDTNNNGIQDEWFDANNDNLVTQNIPDSNGSFDYSKWEWIDLNGDGSYKGEMNVGELNAAGFGNAKSSNLFVTGPNNYSDSVIIGIQGYWRNRPDERAFGNYSVELKMDANLEAQSSAMNATGLVKIIPSTNKNTNSNKNNKAVSFEVCSPTNENPQVADITAIDKVHLDLDFGISCKMFANIQAVNDVYNVTQCSILEELRNAVSNDLLNGIPAAISAFKFKLLTSSVEAITIDNTGNVSFANGIAVGQYTFDYEVCEAANPTNCSTATITINVAGIEPITIASEACNDDTTPIDLSKLLPPGIPTDGTWIDTENTGGLIGNILNAVGIPVNKYTFEYKTQGSCPRSIFLTMDINDDCKVLPCKSIVIHNALSANEDDKNDYFQIENIENNDCYKNFKVEIFNRWGILVFEKENYNNEGNAFRGRSEGRTTINKNEGLPTGTYFYIISYDTVDGAKIQNIKKDGYLYLIK
nr:gliding motility-associated C-terminal domain-containing protein [uncultured Flavobacterium sp.]